MLEWVKRNPFKLLILAGLLISACGGQDDSPDKPNDGSRPTPVEPAPVG